MSGTNIIVTYASLWIFSFVLIGIAMLIFSKKLGSYGIRLGCFTAMFFFFFLLGAAAMLDCIEGCELDSVAEKIYHLDDLWP